MISLHLKMGLIFLVSEILSLQNVNLRSSSLKLNEKQNQNLFRHRRDLNTYVICTNKKSQEYCVFHKTVGHCNQFSIFSQCRNTCNKCPKESSYSNLEWGEWSKCSRTCEEGKQTRTQLCNTGSCDNIKYQVRGCGQLECPQNIGNYDYEEQFLIEHSLSKKMFGRSMVANIKGRIGFGQEKDQKEFGCGERRSRCGTQTTCVEETDVCNGYYECTNKFDEDDCPLGLRYDAKRCIMNWETHKCWDVNTTDSGEIVPWAFRRCPGQKSSELHRYWWYWQRFFFLTHLESFKCLAVNVTKVVNSTAHNVSVILKDCDFKDNFQMFLCEAHSLRVRLRFPDRVLPEDRKEEIYVGMSKEGPGNFLEMTSEKSVSTTDFHILETDKLSICSGRGTGSIPSFITPVCSATCGNGTMKVLRDCAKYGKKDCNTGSRYKVIHCNTKPCFHFCPPGWSVMPSDDNKKDINCFKTFQKPLTYKKAHDYCASQNWTLVADKNLQTHQYILNLQSKVVKAYIGIYEDLEVPPNESSSHSLRFESDHTQVGGFQPWKLYGTFNNIMQPGCILGRGGAYYGTKSRSDSTCDEWGLNQKFQPLEQLVPPYSPIQDGSNYCRNPNLDPLGPWCYTRGKTETPSYCDITDCLNVPGVAGSSRQFPKVDLEHQFLIRSQYGGFGERKWCIAAPTPGSRKSVLNHAYLLPCDISDLRQRFYWWSSVSLVNMGTSTCLSLAKSPPKHEDNIVFRPCDRRKKLTTQHWKGEGDLLLSNWQYASDIVPSNYHMYKVMHDFEKKKIFLSDVKHSLFVIWSKDLGMMRATSLLSRIPAGSFIFLRSCHGCLSHEIRKGFSLVRTVPCSNLQSSQRWVNLGSGRLMNVESGMCLSSFPMRAFAIAVPCNITDQSQTWNWKPAIIEKLLKTEESWLQHVETKYYLRCGCKGLSDVCLTPKANFDNSNWKFLPGITSSFKGRSQKTSGEGILGYPFFFQTSLNLTKCAQPYINGSAGDSVEKVQVIFYLCNLKSNRFLWWMSGLVTQIKHRSLDLCFDSNLDYYNKKAKNHVVILRNCSKSRLEYQSWIFSDGPLLRDHNELPGDYIRLAYNNEYFLSVKVVRNYQVDYEENDFILILKKETNLDKWKALTVRSYVVGIGEMTDCVLPWTKMINYRGTRSWTRDGIRCQPWSSQMPHSHPFLPRMFPGLGLKSNLCRRPPGLAVDIMDKKGDDHAFCMTLKPEVEWQDCLVSKCPVPSVVVMETRTGTWQASTGEEELPFTCQTTGECYYGTGITFAGYTNFTGRGFCKNWREHYNGSKFWPDHNHCQNPSRSFMKPWCWVSKGVAQYCDIVEKCPVTCPDPARILQRMKIVSVLYKSPSYKYPTGSVIQVVCREGYNITLNNGNNFQTITCTKNGKWTPKLQECRKIFCPKPVTLTNARLLTVRTQFAYGSKVAYQCTDSHMVSPGRIVLEVFCLITGDWSKTPYRCLPACPLGWFSFRKSCYKAQSSYKYFKSYEEANQVCGVEEGHLAIPRDKKSYQFINWVIRNDVGHTKYTYWLGVKDTGASKRRLMNRNWVGEDKGDKELFLENLDSYHSFKIKNLGSSLYPERRLAYTDRCMYGVMEKGNGKVFTKSCSFENDTGLLWTWLTYDHLYNIHLGLCISVDSFDKPGIYQNGTQSDSVHLVECDFNSKHQSLTCGPHGGHLLKLRHEKGNYLVMSSDWHGEIHVGGYLSNGYLAMWQAYPSAKYLCHWDIKPSDTYFIVHREKIPSYSSFTFYETHKCLQNVTGASVASLNGFSQAPTGPNQVVTGFGVPDEKLAWCGCLFMTNTDEKTVVSVAHTQADDCAVPNTLASYNIAPGLKLCVPQQLGDTLCTRTDGTSPSETPVPGWGVTLSLPNNKDTIFQPRFVGSRLPGRVCETKAKWQCPYPYQPRYSMNVLDSSNNNNKRFAYGSTIHLHCEPGYRFLGKTYYASITCNKYLKWEVTKDENSDEVLAYVDDRVTREKMVKQLKCHPINCTAPVDYPGMNLTVKAVGENLYRYGTIATYTCHEGTQLRPGKNEHLVTCSQDQTWQTPLSSTSRCSTLECPTPRHVENAKLEYDAVTFGAVANYTCKDGMWFYFRQKQINSKCNASAAWSPSEYNMTCIPVTCPTPSKQLLFKINAEQVEPVITYNIYKSNITLKCLSGYWFDREVFSVNLTCGLQGDWLPINITSLECSEIYCDVPPDVDGALLYGSERRSGLHVNYRCSPFNWLRRAFRLFAPHWRVCVTVTGGADPEFYDPLNRIQPGSDSVKVTLNSDCDRSFAPRQLWTWHWSFHLKNKFTDNCLTAIAWPTLKRDVVEVTVKKCNKTNIYQQWKCSQVKDGSRARLLSLKTASRGAYLTTNGDSETFWTGADQVYLVVTGDDSATGVQSYWEVYGTDDQSVVDICLLREGHIYEKVTCNSQGKWDPDPRQISCTLVDCGPPPDIEGSTQNINKYLPQNGIPDHHFVAPNIKDLINSDKRFDKNSSHPVTTTVEYKCDLGRWVREDVFTFELVCRENGLWSNIEMKNKLIDQKCDILRCPNPKILPHSKAYVNSPKTLLSMHGLPLYRGKIVYLPGVNRTYTPIYNSKLKVICDDGFWILNSELYHAASSDKNGLKSFTAECMSSNKWSENIIETGINCTALTCPDPGHISNAHRSPYSPEKNKFSYNYLFQFQCNSGYWYGADSILQEIRCNEHGTWYPDPSNLSCVEVSCRHPGEVVHAVRSGSNFKVRGKVNYTCTPGRIISDMSQTVTTTCQADGTWLPPFYAIDCQLITCDELPPITHATFINKTQMYPDKFVSDDTAYLFCDTGYMIDLSHSFIHYICDHHGTWHPNTKNPDIQSIRCQPVLCAALPNILPNKATLIGNYRYYKHDDIVSYQCDNGEWIAPNGPEVSIHLKCVTTRTTSALTSNKQAKYSSVWIPDYNTVDCAPITCPHPGLIEYSHISFNGLKYLNITTYTCFTGYQLYPASIFTSSFQSKCERGGKWVPNPALYVCYPVKCSGPGDVQGANRVKDPRENPPYFYGDEVVFRCYNGTYFAPLDSDIGSVPGKDFWGMSCQHDGTWSYNPLDVQVACRPKTCKPPPFIPRTTITTSYNEKDPFQYPISTEYQIKCPDGEVSSNTGMQTTVLQCGKTAIWEPTDPFNLTCEKVNCKDPGPKPNSNRTISGFQYQDTITYFANNGHVLLGVESNEPLRTVTLICGMDGVWSLLDNNLQSFSQQKRKRDISQNQQISLFSLNLLKFVPAKCSQPELFENMTLTDHGFVRTTTIPNIVNSSTTGFYDSMTTVPSFTYPSFNVSHVLEVECKPLHYISINRTTAYITCTEQGHWDPIPHSIHCLPASKFYCDLPKSPANALIELNSYLLESYSSVVCLSGYELRRGVRNQTIKCTKGGIWEPDPLSTTCSPISCNDPPLVTNANRNFLDTLYGSTVEYKCNTGHSLSTLPNDTFLLSTCISANTWQPDPSQLNCSLFQCINPDNLIIPNTNLLDYHSTFYGSKISFECKEGFLFTDEEGGRSSIDVWCGLEGHWIINSPGISSNFTSTPYCASMACGPFPEIENSYIENYIGGTNVGAEIFYRCKPGYITKPLSLTSEPSKTFKASCKKSGLWETFVTVNGSNYECVKVQCPELRTKPNAVVHYTDNLMSNQFYGGTGYVECNNGYLDSWTGLSKVEFTCMWYGDWYPHPDNITCAQLQCTLPTIMEHASGSGGFKANETWTYLCKSGYEISPSSNAVSMFCSTKALWIPHFTALPKCRKLSCPSPDLFPKNAEIYLSSGQKIDRFDTKEYYVAVGMQLSVNCKPGYWIASTRVNKQAVTCQSNRAYMPMLSSLSGCEVVVCLPPGQVPGTTLSGEIGSNNYWFNSTVRYECPNGQHFKDHKLKVVEARCNNSGVFDPQPSTLKCSEVECDNNLMALADRINFTDFKLFGEVTFRCHRGAWYSQGVIERTHMCNSDGRWQPDTNLVKCQPVTCQVETIPNSSVKKSVVQFKNYVDVRCYSGYSLVGPGVLKCIETGVLEPSQYNTKCIGGSCPYPPTPDNAKVIPDNQDFTFGMTAEVRCSEGLFISTGIFSILINCTNYGKWTSDTSQIMCISVYCETPIPIPNGKIFYEDNNYESTVTLTCNKGFKFADRNAHNVTAVCNDKGLWEERLPSKCISVVCSRPNIMESALTFSDSQNYMSSTRYVCKPMYWLASKNATHWVLSGEKEVISECDVFGLWTPSVDNYRCISIYDGDQLTQGTRLIHQKEKSVTGQLGPPYYTLDLSLPTKWLKFDKNTMTISDSYIPQLFTRPAQFKRYRNIRFIWDSNPLTFWVAPSPVAETGENIKWSINIHFGKPRAVFGFMIMPSDNGQSGITTFSIVFAGRDKKTKTMGPFRVYGDHGIVGKPTTNFPFNYSSVSTAWVYDKIKEEMLWFHLVIHGTIVPGTQPIVREIGFFASDAEWRWSYPIDWTPVLRLVQIILAVALVFGVLTYYLDVKKATTVVQVPPPVKDQSFFTHHLSFELEQKLNKNWATHILLQLVAENKLHLPVVWLRGRDQHNLFIKNGSHCKVMLTIDDVLKPENLNLKVLLLSLSEDQGTGYTRMESKLHVDRKDVTISNIKLWENKSNARWQSSKNCHYTLSSATVQTLPLKLVAKVPFETSFFVKILNCHLLFSMLQLPVHSMLSRLERLIIAVLLFASSIAMTVYLQVNFTLITQIETPPTVDLTSNNQRLVETDPTVFQGTVLFLTMGLASTIVCCFIAVLVRYLYDFSKKLTEAKKTKDDFLVQFCSHIVFFYDGTIKLPFMSILRQPLAKFLNFNLLEKPCRHVATCISKDCLDEDAFIDSKAVQRRPMLQHLKNGGSLSVSQGSDIRISPKNTDVNKYPSSITKNIDLTKQVPNQKFATKNYTVPTTVARSESSGSYESTQETIKTLTLDSKISLKKKLDNNDPHYSDLASNFTFPTTFSKLSIVNDDSIDLIGLPQSLNSQDNLKSSHQNIMRPSGKMPRVITTLVVKSPLCHRKVSTLKYINKQQQAKSLEKDLIPVQQDLITTNNQLSNSLPKLPMPHKTSTTPPKVSSFESFETKISLKSLESTSSSLQLGTSSVQNPYNQTDKKLKIKSNINKLLSPTLVETCKPPKKNFKSSVSHNINLQTRLPKNINKKNLPQNQNLISQDLESLTNLKKIDSENSFYTVTNQENNKGKIKADSENLTKNQDISSKVVTKFKNTDYDKSETDVYKYQEDIFHDAHSTLNWQGITLHSTTANLHKSKLRNMSDIFKGIGFRHREQNVPILMPSAGIFGVRKSRSKESENKLMFNTNVEEETKPAKHLKTTTLSNLFLSDSSLSNEVSKTSTPNLSKYGDKAKISNNQDEIDSKPLVLLEDNKKKRYVGPEHHTVNTHLSLRKPMCYSVFSVNSLLSWFICLIIIAICTYLVYMGQYLNTNSTWDIYNGALSAVGFVIAITMVFDAFVGYFVFHEQSSVKPI